MKPFSAFIVFVLLWVAFACQSSDDKQGAEAGQQADSSEQGAVSTPPPPKKLETNQKLTNTALLIAGMDVAGDSALAAISQKDFFKSHKQFVDETFKMVVEKHVKPVKKWVAEHDITNGQDTTTLFYPFSGPDFLYANTFFPYANNYIMVALEQRGSLPDFAAMTDAEQRTYFKGIEKSLDYSNKVGYFVTQHMGSDFSHRHLNGNLHMILYFLARTGHQVIDISTVYLNEQGQPVAVNQQTGENEIKALNIKFTDEQAERLRNIYYFRLDVSDNNLQANPQFYKFIDSFKPFNTYIKSASYILFNPGFVGLRQHIIENSKTILQDDTGVPYNVLKDAENLEVKLYGTYTGVISQLRWAYQPDLRKALEKEGDNTELPFRISYNAWHNEGMLIHARRK